MRLRCRESPERPARTGRIERVNVKGRRWCGGARGMTPCPHISAAASDARRTPPFSTGSAEALLALRMAELGAI
jgi:hypothetical protein